jgi:hypothetical protein
MGIDLHAVRATKMMQIDLLNTPTDLPGRRMQSEALLKAKRH